MRWLVGALLLTAVGLAVGWALRPDPPAPTVTFRPDPARRKLVEALYASEAAGSLTRIASCNARLGQAALVASRRVLDAWWSLRDPATGLVPRSEREPLWNAKDVGADLFPHLLLAAERLDPSRLEPWTRLIAVERALSGPFARTILLAPTEVVPDDPRGLVAGATEYVTDGLLAIAERLGPGPWLERLEELVRLTVDNARTPSPRGFVPSARTEMNGNLLQAIPRLYSRTRDPALLEMAERVADAYLLEIIPANGGLPPHTWNGPGTSRRRRACWFRDHGAELIPGLAELYALERAEGLEAADRHAEPLHALLRALLDVERTADGLWYDRVDPATGRVTQRAIADTWGYVLNAYQIADLAEGRSRYGDEIRRVMQAAASRSRFPWEGDDQDGYADAIEGMLSLLRWHDPPGCRRWVDDEMEVLLGKQQPDGFIERRYLDGNFIRTCLLYADWKSRGARLEPWDPRVAVGAADLRDEPGVLVVAEATDARWTGRLRFDGPRHRTIWNLRLDYPRRNSAPEWFTVDRAGSYTVTDRADGSDRTVSGSDLLEGLALTVRAGETRALVVRPLR